MILIQSCLSQKEHVLPLAARQDRVESTASDCLPREEYKTGQLLTDMKLAEVTDTLKMMDSVIWEMDPGEDMVRFGDDIQAMQVDMAVMHAVMESMDPV